MPTYKLRPDTWDAREFTGGKKNAKKLMKWLKKYNLDSSWSPSITMEDGAKTREALVILCGPRADRIYTDTTIFFKTRDADLLRRDPKYHLMYTEDFHKKYETHEEV